jgi:hypothetical protein
MLRVVLTVVFLMSFWSVLANGADTPKRIDSILFESGPALLDSKVPYTGIRVYANGDLESFNELPEFARPARIVAHLGAEFLANLKSDIERIHLDKTPLKMLPAEEVCYGGIRKITRVLQNGSLTVVRDANGPCRTLVPQDAAGIEDKSEKALAQIADTLDALEAYATPVAPESEGGFHP